jgi:hypothetical protein
MAQTLTTEQLRAFTEPVRALDDNDLSNLAWCMYCEQQDRLNRRRASHMGPRTRWP